MFILNTILWKSTALKKLANIAFLDIQKAYDSVNREILWTILTRMGFGGKFLDGLKKLYKAGNVTCDIYRVPTEPVFLGQGL